jgi:hypothetical protein
MEIDRKAANQDFTGWAWNTASFAVSTPVGARFIRLTQTDTNLDDRHELVLRAVEFFGTLAE